MCCSYASEYNVYNMTYVYDYIYIYANAYSVPCVYMIYTPCNVRGIHLYGLSCVRLGYAHQKNRRCCSDRSPRHNRIIIIVGALTVQQCVYATHRTFVVYAYIYLPNMQHVANRRNDYSVGRTRYNKEKKFTY